MDGRIYIVSGCKGGVGKSMVSMYIVDYFERHNRTPVLIETDTSNPDVGWLYKDRIKCETLNLDVKDGWMELIKICNTYKKSPIIVNSCARSNEGVKDYANLLTGVIDELDCSMITLWVINRQRSSLELLIKYLSAMPISHAHSIHVIRNLYFGSSDKFQLFDKSNIKQIIEGSGCETYDFSDLADIVADKIANDLCNLSQANKDFDIGYRAELNRWRHANDTILGKLLA
jgi:hypothetical protein